MASDHSAYRQRFESERALLHAALGETYAGGIIEQIEHIGATSVPGLYGSTCIDIGIAAWPFPLEEGVRAKLEALGYHSASRFDSASGQRFVHETGASQLFFADPGTGANFDWVLLRDYLRNNPAAMDELSIRKMAGENKVDLFAQGLSQARTWWIEQKGFTPLAVVTEALTDAPFDWYISGGWALDLFLGRVTRVHYDVDVVVPRLAQMGLQKHLLERAWKLITPFEKKLMPWPVHMRLELPRHQVHAHREESFIDFLLTDIEEGVWRYRREPRILRAVERMSLISAEGVPYLAPELVLLFKSRNTSGSERAKDQNDFENIVRHLELERRAWLRWALIATQPEHPWLKQL